MNYVKQIILKAVIAYMVLSIFMTGMLITSVNAAETSSTDQANQTIDFAYAKANSIAQHFTSDKGGGFDIYATTLHTDPLNDVHEVIIYGKLNFPLTSQDIGIEEFDEKLFLAKDENFVIHNDYIKSFMIWAPEDTNPKYDKQIFKVDGLLYSKSDIVKLTLANQVFEIKIPVSSSSLDTSYLEDAILEHWNDYLAIKTSGLLLEDTSETSYLDKNKLAKALVKTAKEENSSLTQDSLENMRKELNTVFGDLKPLPFPRDVLKDLVKTANHEFRSNGMQNKRFTKETYDNLLQSYAIAQKLLSLEDLQLVVIPKHGKPLYTHKDFKDAETKLQESI